MICLLLAAVAFIAFWQVLQSDFTTFDDPAYITENLHVQNGFTGESIRWAFTTTDEANWHPLTWLSHMLDVRLFGLNPEWHHLTNLLFHIANTLLLFFVLYRMTKAPWKSAFVAALFAIHPLHVESVAWMAERKDVLSTFFWMLTTGAYIHYVEHPRFKSYLAVLTFFILGLLAKPMLVTLPFVLLLLDYWPLRRFEQEKSTRELRSEAEKPGPANKRKGKSGKKHAPRHKLRAEKPAEHKNRWELIRLLLWEKIPLFALTALSSVATFIAQKSGGAVLSLESLSSGERIKNAFVSYASYIEKMIRPSNLAVYYPHARSLPLWQVSGAVLLVAAITAMVVWKAKKFPYLASGWLWYAGTLVPVIGIVQVGGQAMADRYTYIPLIGLFIMIAWGVPELLEKWRYRKEVLFALTAVSLSYLFILTWIQVGYWRNSMELYDRALKVTDRNHVIHNNRGVANVKLGNFRQAMDDYDEALKINPQYALAYCNRGIAHAANGNNKQAIEDYIRAIEINSKYAKAYFSRGVARGELGNHKQAVEDYDRAIAIDPQYADAYYNRGLACIAVGNYGQAISDFEKTVEINPHNATTHTYLGSVHGKLGNYEQAIANFDRAIEINPHNADAYLKRSVAHSKLGNRNQATADLKTAARLDNEDAKNALRSASMNW